MKKLLLFLMILITSGMETNIAMSAGNTDEILSEKGNGTGSYSHISTSDLVRDIVNHPAFKGFGQYLLPWDNGTNYYNTPLNNVSSLLPYHNHVDPDIVVGAINHMIDEINDGKTIFYDFYTEQQKKENPTKESTGLFFFRGKLGAPFAIVCPGGGFAYVGSLHEGFPHAIELSEKGYNAFVLKYRVGGGLRATEDLAAAISYIFKKAETFEVSTEDYSLWGSSAGARMVGNIALNGTASFGGYDLPKPRIVVIAYTGHTSFSENYPPVFITVSEDDGIVNVSVVDRRVENLRNAGIEVEYHKYKNAGHGFGLGVGTDADGWIKHAIQFWENHLSK
ncbi:MAG TPA: alpha/beta hydrolase [Sulfurovum sp.]|nr:alpha/beta hydrolase [Sulfurovum sp.]